MIDIRPLTESESTLSQLSALLIDVVAGGGSVSFMHPLAPEAARNFWEGALTSAAKGERIVLGAWDGNILTATLTLLLDCPPNQPHRAELAKMMTSPSYRGRGIAKALALVAEQLAIQHQRTLLMLDTASEDGAAGFYEKLGYTLVGEVPDYALKPHGGLTGTLFYWKRLTLADRLSKERGTA